MCVYVCARVCVPVYIHLITWGPHHPELPHHLLVIPRNTRCRQIKPVPTLFSTLIAPRGPQSNLSDNFVMGSPPHPWRPDSDEGQYFASRQPLSHSSVTHAHHVRTCVCLSLRPSLTPPPLPPLLLVQLSGATGNTPAICPWTLRLKGTPHQAIILCVYTIPKYVLAYSLRDHSSPDRCLYRDQLVAISPHHILTMARCCHWTSPFGPEAASPSTSGPVVQNR